MNLYDFCYNYLIEQTSGLLSKDQIDCFVNDVDSSKKDMRSIYEQLIICLQDYQSMPNIIKYDERKEQISNILFDFDLKKVTNISYLDIYNNFKNKFSPNIRNDKNNSWLKFSKGVFDSAKFLSQFENYEDFILFIDSFQTNSYTKLALPLILSEEIHGLGFALACNWLKEIGFTEFPKPDTHMIDVFSAIGLCEKNQISCYKAMVNVANQCKVSPYALDKVVWLICSGNYYRYNIKSNRSSYQLKSNFISSLVHFYNTDLEN